jgi:hypothetical protein
MPAEPEQGEVASTPQATEIAPEPQQFDVAPESQTFQVSPEEIHVSPEPWREPVEAPPTPVEVAAELAPQPGTPDVSAAIPRRRYGTDVELPVEVVNEDERRLHNDARRFARLLVSEIKLYNEQKVSEGRSQNDLYVRLREYIDRSREMYDKRVKPEVAGRYDYFHQELVNTLAEGDEAKLGSGYPGAALSV